MNITKAWLLGVLIVAMSGVPGVVSGAEIEWGPAFEIETDADIDVSNQIVRAVNVADPNSVPIIEVVFPGDLAIEFEPEHTFEFNDALNDVGLGAGSVTGTDVFYSGLDDRQFRSGRRLGQSWMGDRRAGWRCDRGGGAGRFSGRPDLPDSVDWRCRRSRLL
jgi:hypothetical protein